jgi:hypothetical protein
MFRGATSEKFYAQWRAYRAPLGFGIRTTVAAITALLIAEVFTLPLHGLWVVLTATVVTQLSVGGSLRAGLEYVLGTLGDAWADTTTPHGRLMLTVLGGLAEFERELIRARTGEGRARAVARGVKLGRNPKLTPHQQREALARREAGETVTDIARTYNVHHSTISRLS